MTATLKSASQKWLRQVGLYERVKASWLYDVYWNLVDRQLIHARDQEVGFYRATLNGMRRGALIYDVGANQGYKTDIFLRLGARVLAIDPDRINQGVLERRFLKLRLSPKPVTVVRKAVSEQVSVATLWVDEPGSAKNTLNQKWVDTLRHDEKRFGERLEFGSSMQVETTTMERLVAEHGQPFYVKIDVEGHEPSVLRGLKAAVPYLSFEVNLPEFKAEGLECVELLMNVSPEGEFNYVGDCHRGLVLPEWVSGRAFARVFEEVKDACVEIFWRNRSLLAER